MCDLMRRHLWSVPLFLAVVSSGCGQRPPEPSRAVATAPDAVATRPEVLPDVEKTPAKEIAPAATAPLRTAATGTSSSAGEAPVVADHAIPAAAEPTQGSAPAEPPGPTRPDARSLDEQLAGLRVPPAWLEEVRTQYDTSHPWKDARLEIRRLLSLNTEAARKEAIKLTWIYLQKKDIGDGHEYPMYLFLGGEPLWAVRAHEEFLAQPHEVAPDHAYISLAVLYTHFGEFAKAKATLDDAMARLPAPPWRIARKASLHEAYGDLFVAWAKPDLAKEHYAEAIRLYPTSDQPYGQHLFKRQADRVQSKLDLLSIRSLTDTRLRDGRYTSTALGYAADLQVTLVVRDGRMADIQVKHEEKIDQGACTIIPQRIIEKQSLQVDGISSATVTTSAILDGTLQCLRQAGLQ